MARAARRTKSRSRAAHWRRLDTAVRRAPRARAQVLQAEALQPEREAEPEREPAQQLEAPERQPGQEPVSAPERGLQETKPPQVTVRPPASSQGTPQSSAKLAKHHVAKRKPCSKDKPERRCSRVGGGCGRRRSVIGDGL